jgi:hypothetical protein
MSEPAIAWYITYGDDAGYNNVLFFKTEQAAWDAVDEMNRINDEEEHVYNTYRGFRPTPLTASDIKERFEDV